MMATKIACQRNLNNENDVTYHNFLIKFNLQVIILRKFCDRWFHGLRQSSDNTNKYNHLSADKYQHTHKWIDENYYSLQSYFIYPSFSGKDPHITYFKLCDVLLQSHMMCFPNPN